MPAKSKEQFDLMRGIAAGKIKKEGLSKKEAREYISGQKREDLPEKKRKKKRFTKLFNDN